MANNLREQLGWTEQREQAINEAVAKTMASSAVCRRVIPKGPDHIGAKTVAVPVLKGGGAAAFEFDEDKIIAPVRLTQSIKFDDTHDGDETAILRLVEAAASQLGRDEDASILGGVKTKGRVRNGNAALKPKKVAKVGATTVDVPQNTNAEQLFSSIADAMVKLEDASRPGPCGLLLNSGLAALLRKWKVGELQAQSAVEQLIGSNDIAGTSALLKGAGKVCGILLRLEPAAIDVVYTQAPTLTLVERAGAKTTLCLEQEIVVRVFDPSAVVRLIQK